MNEWMEWVVQITKLLNPEMENGVFSYFLYAKTFFLQNFDTRNSSVFSNLHHMSVLSRHLGQTFFYNFRAIPKWKMVCFLIFYLLKLFFCRILIRGIVQFLVICTTHSIHSFIHYGVMWQNLQFLSEFQNFKSPTLVKRNIITFFFQKVEIFLTQFSYSNHMNKIWCVTVSGEDTIQYQSTRVLAFRIISRSIFELERREGYQKKAR